MPAAGVTLTQTPLKVKTLTSGTIQHFLLLKSDTLTKCPRDLPQSSGVSCEDEIPGCGSEQAPCHLLEQPPASYEPRVGCWPPLIYAGGMTRRLWPGRAARTINPEDIYQTLLNCWFHKHTGKWRVWTFLMGWNTMCKQHTYMLLVLGFTHIHHSPSSFLSLLWSGLGAKQLLQLCHR